MACTFRVVVQFKKMNFFCVDVKSNLCRSKVSIKSEIVTNDFDYCVVVIMYSKQIQFYIMFNML